VNSPLQIGRSNNWVKVFRNEYSNFCIKSDGTLWAWGSNSNGHLGSGNGNKIYSPTKIGTSNQWVEIQSDGFSTIGLKSNGTLWACGGNGFGELGQNNTISILEFTQIGFDKDWISYRFNGSSAFAIKSNGTLFSWGFNGSGCLGLNNLTKSEILSPTQIGTDTKWKKIISNYNYSNMSVYAIKTDETLWAWGNNSYSQLGLGDNNSKSIPVQSGIDSNWTSIQIAKNGFVIAQKKDGTLWSWGRGVGGVLGLSNTNSYSSPRQVGSLTTWRGIATGQGASFGVKTDGTLWSWGDNTYGTLGLGNTTSYSSPKQVGAATTWTTVATSFYSAYALG
jgi:alpha-tubulin suppressor-like RCC1 family protein